MSGFDESELMDRGMKLALKLADYIKENGYSIAEAGIATTILNKALVKIAVLGLVFGDKAGEMIDAVMEGEIEKMMEEAEGVLRDEH